MIKICSKCKIELPATTEFFREDKRLKNGLRANCKNCERQYGRQYHQDNIDKCNENLKMWLEKNPDYHKQYRQNNLEKEKGRSKKYYDKNKNSEEYHEKKSEWCMRWRQENIDKRNQYIKQYRQERKDKLKEERKYYYIEHRQESIEKRRLYRKENQEKENQYAKQYRRKNPEIMRINNQRRNARKKNLSFGYTLKQWETAKQYFNDKCAYCGKEVKLTQDHFIPLINGGEYTINNIIPACGHCNSSKNNKNFFEWFSCQDFYSKKKEQKIFKYLNYDTKTKIQQLALI